MTDRLNPKIIVILEAKLGKTAEQIRPRLSELRRKHSGLTMNAAAQMYAMSHNTSIMGKLDVEDRQSLATVQAITQVSVSSVSKVDKRTLNINNSPIHNLSFGDRNQVGQSVVNIDNSLEKLSKQIEKSTVLTDDEKNDYKSDIETIASQVGKSKPNRSIIKTAWEGIKALSELEGFAQAVAHTGTLIQHFIS
ncbi:MAG: hypothetical protein A2845_04000 [Candidatus Lloydbacteria bacterium RIFCSPHIGHO2_01_FULL_49_22]|uniref:Uncharacterized protein n=1 Tax=Candidatus Lloydbacteria bacterium RIFCSPHIGHO2_01_FULL_49_22 TaxID=1798658 RepID=A0A1G2CX31_9BACT|nr:MAG: hypothetical protein A2845_04000 [Candidatus Lloydbacteria bacterium RIFCSPHIGHO2_01_FULL_49_22]OGZ09089.1 MAG: hypothetical protein A3C14_03835 [Candidatus Lloydbacteria bacterium RIFCSPHIGHO2_02_FULL_50_18]